MGPDQDIINDKSYLLLYDRLRKGRAERELKNSIHSREEIPKSLVIEISKPKPDLSTIPKVKPVNPKPPKKQQAYVEPVAKPVESLQTDVKSDNKEDIQEKSKFFKYLLNPRG